MRNHNLKSKRRRKNRRHYFIFARRAENTFARKIAAVEGVEKLKYHKHAKKRRGDEFSARFQKIEQIFENYKRCHK